MHTRTRAQRRSGKKKGKQRKLSHVYERPDSFVRLREASKVYCTIMETRSGVGYHAHYFCTLKPDLRVCLKRYLPPAAPGFPADSFDSLSL
jgi:hypothetical protein